MLKVQVIAVGKMKEAWMRAGLAEYGKRLSAFCRLEIIEVEEYRLGEHPSAAEIERAMSEEGRHILQKAAGSLLFPLCIEGELLSSEELAGHLADAAQKTGCVSFIIGGSFGLSAEVKQAGARKFSFSRMTFPHQLMRVILSEQLYRAFSINAGGKYHK